MDQTEEILSFFEQVNIKPDQNVLQKCTDMCKNYNIEPEDFVDLWLAFTASKLNGIAPSLEALEKMEKQEFQKQNKQNLKALNTPKSANGSNYYLNNSPSTLSVPSTPKVNRVVTPIKPSLSQMCGEMGSSEFPKDSYAERKNALSVGCSFGKNDTSFKRQNTTLELQVKSFSKDVLQTNGKYMYEIMGYKSQCLDYLTDWVGCEILRKNGLQLPDKSSKKGYSGQTTTYGRICCDSEGKLNAQSILLETSRKLSNAEAMHLNIKKLSKYALFPGQIVAVEGKKITHSFIAESIYTDATLNLPMEIPLFSDPVEIVIAAGPFTLQNNLQYEPLQDLILYVKEYKPHILILMGPFLEETHKSINTDEFTSNFSDFFEQLIEMVASPLTDIDTKILIISSQADIHHHCVYPTPPYEIKGKFKNVTFLPDPCMLQINGLVIGATTADILFHLGKEEIFVDLNAGGLVDRLGRLASYVLQQQNFYPLYPPAEDMNIDHSLFEQYGYMDCLPHIMVLPSKLRHFIKKINDCLVINPERLAKGFIGGSFARIEISPGSSASICSRVASQVVYI